MFAYYYSVVCEAFRQTRALFEWSGKTFIPIGMYLLGVYVFYRARGLVATLNQLADNILLLLIPAAFTFSLLLIINLFRAPFLLMRKTKLEIQSLSQEVNGLRKENLPRLAIRYESGQEPFDHTEPALASRRAFHIYRIGIENCGNQKLTNCSVKLHGMKPGLNVYLPMTLKQKSDNPSDVLNLPHKMTFDLYPEERVEIDVACLDETNPNSEIRLCYALEGHRSLNVADEIPREEYELTIRAYAEIGQNTEARFKLWVDSEGYLRFQRFL
jgi:hypothetical protein